MFRKQLISEHLSPGFSRVQIEGVKRSKFLGFLERLTQAGEVVSREPKLDTTVIVHCLGGFRIEIGD